VRFLLVALAGLVALVVFASLGLVALAAAAAVVTIGWLLYGAFIVAYSRMGWVVYFTLDDGRVVCGRMAYFSEQGALADAEKIRFIKADPSGGEQRVASYRAVYEGFEGIRERNLAARHRRGEPERPPAD
jgi:hypothetical protein